MSVKVSEYGVSGIIEELEEREILTPDFHHLRMYSMIPIMVYGAAMKSGAFSHLLDDALYMGRAATVLPRFFMRGGGKYPIVFQNKNLNAIAERWRNAPILGEAYACSVEHIHMLDNLEQNGEMFNRIWTKIRLPDQMYFSATKYRQQSYCDAFMYVANEENWKGVCHSPVDKIDDPTTKSDDTVTAQRVYYWDNSKIIPEPQDKKIIPDYGFSDCPAI